LVINCGLAATSTGSSEITEFTALVAGFITMVINSYLGFFGLHSLPLFTIKILLEPCAWFLLWLGFDFLFYDLRELKREKDLFGEFSELNIHFETS
jgi:hypothetical protein